MLMPPNLAISLGSVKSLLVLPSQIDQALAARLRTAALLLVPRIVPESRLGTMRRRFDARGALAGTVGLVLLVDAVSQAPRYGWGATRTIVVLAGAVALLSAFLVIESRAKDPILPLSIFRLRTLAGANAAGLLLGGSFFALSSSFPSFAIVATSHARWIDGIP